MLDVVFTDLGVHWYGFWIALGVLLWLVLAMHDVRVRRILTSDQLIQLLNWSIVVGLFGGRLMHVMVNWQLYHSWYEVLAFWQGGLSVLGALFSVLLVFGFFARVNQVSLVLLLDGITSYAPLAQAFGRIGCFSAGCCYGCPAHCMIGISACIDGQYSVIHPVQLYNVALLMILFLGVQALRYLSVPRGVSTIVSISGLLAVRFVTDFWRGDREWSAALPWFSIHQWVSLVGIVLCILGYVAYWVCDTKEGGDEQLLV